jgi:hypothetical protein
MPCDHIAVYVHMSKFEDEIKFLLGAFGHMGMKEFMRPIEGVVGLGEETPWLWLSALHGREAIADDVKLLPFHLALKAKGMLVTALYDTILVTR